ncbi:MAG: hypothetical protein JW904_11500 [Spirochaetales bacterium]|nr:hypothetical protein [Spirochaetales bacterium]
MKIKMCSCSRHFFKNPLALGAKTPLAKTSRSIVQSYPVDTMNPFRELPDNFFIPLSYKNKEHFAALLICYYELFLEFHSGVERAFVVSSFERYFEGLGNAVPVIDEEDEGEPVNKEPSASRAGEDRADTGPAESALEQTGSPRGLASFFLRRLVWYGWMSEEVLADFTQVINMPVWAKHFYIALHEVTRGTQVEYESHIIGVYSSLCSDSAAENGHHAVLNARNHTRLLIDSLKILSQNIKTHVQKIFDAKTEVKDILHFHYDIYMREIVDKAYNRLKTSDNLSKYRPLVNRKINEFLQNDEWLSRAAVKLAVIRNRSGVEAKKEIIDILKEIRDDLKSIDPMLEEIDDKNRQYSRISTEKIKARLYADSSLQGKIGRIIQAIVSGNGGQYCPEVRHHIPGTGFLARESLYIRRHTREEDVKIPAPVDNAFEIELLETELVLRIKNQLNPAKITEFLNTACGQDGTRARAEDMVADTPSFVRLLYAAAYAEGRQPGFPFRVEWGKKSVRKGRFVFREHSFMRSTG